MEILSYILIMLILMVGFTVFVGAPYVPSKRRHVEDAFKYLYKIDRKDVLVDLGAGDGTVLRVAHRYGAKRATGYELSPIIATIGWLLSRGCNRVEIKCTNMWYAKFPKDTTIVYIFGDARDIKKYESKIQSEATRIGQSLSVVSYGFKLPTHEEVKSYGAHHLYVINPLHQKKPQV